MHYLPMRALSADCESMSLIHNCNPCNAYVISDVFSSCCVAPWTCDASVVFIVPASLLGQSVGSVDILVCKASVDRTNLVSCVPVSNYTCPKCIIYIRTTVFEECVKACISMEPP